MTTFANGESASSVRTKINAAITTVDGLGTISTQNAASVAITGGTITGITDLAVADGGTGISTYAIGDILYASATGVLSKLADVATGNALISGGVGVAPAYGKVGLATHVSGALPVANGGTNITSYTIGSIPYASAAGVISQLLDVATGNALISGGVGVAPAYGKIGLATHVSGTLPLANGGTGAITAPAAAAALMGYTTTATAAGTTVLTNTSSQYQLFTGATTQTITLPVTTSGFATGWSFHIVNNSTGNLTVNASSGALVCTIIPGVSVMATCISTAVTDATAWEFGFTDFSTITGTGAAVLASGATLTGAAVNGTVGATTPSTGAFTTLSASSTVSGTGFSTYLASPPAIGGTAAASVTGSTLVSNSVITDGFITHANGTLALAFGSDGVCKVTPTATGTFTSTVPPAGTRATLIVLTSGVTSFTMTFGTGFKTTGTLATGTVAARYFVFQFISDGTSLIECSRTTAIA